MNDKMKEVYEFLKKVGTYYIATVDGDEPKVRPFGTVMVYEDKLCFQTGIKKDVAKQLIANPNVELCAFDGQKWLRVRGKAVHDGRIEAEEAMLADYPELGGMYKPGDGNTAVFFIDSPKAAWYSFTEAPREYGNF